MSSELWLTQLHENGYRITGARRARSGTVLARFSQTDLWIELSTYWTVNPISLSARLIA